MTALTTLLQHGFGQLRQTPDGLCELVLTFVPRPSETLPELHARVDAARCEGDTLLVSVRDGRIAKIELIRHC